MSHPMWVRGLKPTVKAYLLESDQSHPMWVRGLKQSGTSKSGTKILGRTLCGCVD